jgi:carboxyl-terminal processing protease
LPPFKAFSQKNTLKFPAVILVLSAFHLFAQAVTPCGKQSHAVWSLVKKYHYSPKPLDDALSAEIVDSYIDAIDPGGYYFLQSDIDELMTYNDSVDDQIIAKQSGFFDRSAELFKIRLRAVDSLITVIGSKPFDFKKDESLSYAEADYPDYVSDYTQLKERWRKWLKYSTLEELIWGDYFEDGLNEPIENLLLKAADATADAIAYERFEIKSYLEHPAGYEKYLATFYLDAIATCFDPYTTYFSSIEKENFESDLSGENLVFGFSVEADDKGVVRIAGLTPGSPAWNSGDLNKGDEIIALELSDGQRLEMTTAGIDEITLLFANSNAKKLTLEIKKVSGQEKKVTIEKGPVYVEEDVIKNVILVGEKKLGYITLPDFYMAWDDPGGLGCANDVAKIIVKLQKENIDGLILDLRDNGGGSLKEAIDLAGLFIDWGPLSVIRNKYGEMTTLKDMNKGASYTGPLLVLVNGLSASASELFAAAMQDYNRAIILGSPTYGKATGQIIYPVDPRYIRGVTAEKDLDESYGYLKITEHKLYRISTRTHQKTGVIPDILLPDIYDIYEYKESTHHNALAADSIVKTMYYTPFAAFPASLAANSQARVSANTHFMVLHELIDSINQRNEGDEIIALQLEKYQAAEKAYEAFLDKLFGEGSFVTGAFKATNNLYDQEIMNMNAWRRELNAEYLKSIEADLYIDEAYHVLTDYLNSK